MRINNLNKAAFSLLEILLAAVIFAVSVIGIFATLSAVRTPVLSQENSLIAAVFAKQVLEALRSQVSQTLDNYYACSIPADGTVAAPCPDFSLSVGTHQVATGNLPAGITWPAILINANLHGQATAQLVYTVSCADGSGTYGSNTGCTTNDINHKVDLNVQY